MLVATIKSMTTEGIAYKVFKHGVGEWECTCPRHQHTKPGKDGKKFPCKHLRMAWSKAQAAKKEGRIGVLMLDNITVLDLTEF